MSLIEVNHLVKEFYVSPRKSGVRGAVANLFHKEKKLVRAVDDISFSIERGEIVGYLGPNGAGKSTTVKMLSGILHPTSGEISIHGLSPQKNRKEVVGNLGVVFGQRTQLYWDLRLGESFELVKRIYRIDEKVYQENLRIMNEVLEIDEIIGTPVRQLSLGQRMRGDLVAAMLHSPEILFLDEPTIGLDVEAKYAIRKFIKEINEKYGTTIILTTHDLDDVEQLCERLIIINHGKVVEDGPLKSLMGKMAPFRELMIELEEWQEDISHPKASVTKREGNCVWLRFAKEDISASQLIADMTAMAKVKDLCVIEPDIEDVIREVYKH